MVLLGKYAKGKKPVSEEIRLKRTKMMNKGLGEADKEKALELATQMKNKRSILKMKMLEEQKLSHFNYLKVLTTWREMIRLAKTEELKGDIKFHQQNHDREAEAKNALIITLDRDLDEAEEQHLLAVNNFFIHVEKLIKIQESRVVGLREEFLRDAEILRKEFETENEEIREQHNKQKKELEYIITEVTQEGERKEKNMRSDNQGFTEGVKNQNMEEQSNMRTQIIGKIHLVNRDFELHHGKVNSEITTLLANYDSMHKTKEKNDAQIQKYNRSIERLKKENDKWRLKTSQNAAECNARNKALEKEKEKLAKHYQELKGKMSKFRDEESKKLSELTIYSKKCIDKLKDVVKLSEVIHKKAELCRKLETEREKVLPFYQNDPDTQEEKPEAVKEDIKGFKPGEYNQFLMMDNFYKRYNKVLLDKLSIQKQKQTLEKENAFFKSLLKQYLDGVSVNDDVMNSHNPLLVVNNKVYLNRPPIEKADKVVVIEGNTEVTNMALQKK
jgi:hypothetical protein